MELWDSDGALDQHAGQDPASLCQNTGNPDDAQSVAGSHSEQRTLLIDNAQHAMCPEMRLCAGSTVMELGDGDGALDQHSGENPKAVCFEKTERLVANDDDKFHQQAVEVEGHCQDPVTHVCGCFFAAARLHVDFRGDEG